MTLLKNGCCCVSLQRFALGVGWLGCIQSAFASIRVILTLAEKTEEHYGFIALKLIMCTIQFFVCIELIRGAQNYNRRMVVPWLAYNVIALFVVNVLVVLYIIAYATDDMLDTKLATRIIAIFIILMALIETWWIYVWLCIYSFYQELTMNENIVKL